MSVKMSASAVSHRQRLALRLLQNWTAQHPTDTGQTPTTTTTTAVSQQPAVVDDSLTSLTWLQNLNVMKLAPGSSNSSSGRRTPTSGSGGHVTGSRPTGAVQPMLQPMQQHGKSVAPHHAHVDPNAILDMTGAGSSATAGGGSSGRGNNARVKTEPGSPASRSPPLPHLSPPPPPGDGGDSSPPLPSLQRSDCGAQGSSAKPSHSYATLICMAMNDSPDQRVTLSNIYSWILENFPYFRTADPSWQNSIRHILSLNKCFQRVQREKSDPGKGSYWTVNPDFQSIVDRDFFRKRPATATTPGGGQATKVCRRSTVSEGQHASSSATVTTRRDSPAATEDKFLSDLSGDDDDETLKDGPFLDMSWSTILGRSLSCPSGQTLELPQPTADLRPQRDNCESSSSDIRPVAADNDAELDELIRACTSSDPDMLDDIGDFALDVADSDSLDLTIYGIGLRPPDWWSSPNSSFDSGSGFTTSSGTEAAARRQALNTPSPGPDEQEDGGQQQQPHPWAENTGSTTMSSLDSSLVALGLLLDGPQTPFDSDAADDF